ncbi:hypothetical protein [Arenimonas sp. MALMAid1274]|uniref:hypothetical protein n=1 Tax=Arenimonas sp. MALMAid1274 TaxID=3411630 RepID=UPI003BA24447
MRLGMIAVLVLAMVGCGHDRPPRDYRPAEGSCEDLRGHWIVDAADLGWLVPDRRLPQGTRFTYLSIVDDRNGSLSLVLRPRREDLLAQAATLRLTDQDAYRAWRAGVLGEPMEGYLGRVANERPGPAVAYSWQMGMSECRRDWRHGGGGYDLTPAAGRDPAENLAFLALGRGEGGELLIERHVRRENSFGNFFGQPIRYYTYAYSEWRRLSPVPPGQVPAPLTAKDLVVMPSAADRMWGDIDRRRGWSNFGGWVRDNVPAGTVITLLRERPMDPVAMGLPLDQIRIELAGHWPTGAPDPFTPLLQRHPGVGPIEVKQSRLQPDNRSYLLLEFTFTVEPGPR